MSEDATLDEFFQEQSGEERESGWSESKLEDLLSKLLTGGRPTGGGLDEGEYISIGGTQVNSEGYIDLHDLVYIPQDYFEKVGRTQLQRHDILVVKDGANTGDVAIAWESDDRIVTNEHLFTLRADSSINSPYLFYFLLSNQGWKQIKGTITGSAQEGINQGFTGKVDIKYPSLSEQRKIATVLYTVDRAIEKTEEIIDQTERVRRGYIKQQVLALDSDSDRQEGVVGTRRVSIPGSWETVRLGDVARIVSGKSFPREYQEGHAGSRAVIKVEDMNLPGNDKYIKEVTNRVTDEVLDELSKNIFPKNTVIHPRVGEALLLNKTRITGEDAAFDDNIMGWVPEGIDPGYLYYSSTLIDFNAVAQTGTVPSINKEMAANFRFPLPPEEEQKRIARDISRIDGQISIYEEEKTRLKRLKRGLMQDLLSGTVRTTDTNIEVPEEIAQYG